jgi:hypothetical protein
VYSYVSKLSRGFALALSRLGKRGITEERKRNVYVDENSERATRTIYDDLYSVNVTRGQHLPSIAKILGLFTVKKSLQRRKKQWSSCSTLSNMSY